MWTYPAKMIAHRGGGNLAPENTIAALRCGLSHGFHAAEFDVMDAADGLVLMHDPERGRTVQGQGSIGDCTLADLAAMDAGAWFAPAFAGEPVPTFAVARDFCLAHGIWMNAEIKPVPGTEAATGRQVALACAALPAGSVLLSSFAVDALLAARDAAPTVPRALLVEAVPDDWVEQLQQVGAVALHAKAALLTPIRAAAVKAAGYGLLCYTVNDPAQARELFAMGVDAICTDRLDLIGPGFA
ncbi:MAG: hypothetical protein RL404_2588 [Pseudomonadota bacterium]|jgi:glycerophosphoryl diester phosphodiesterase